MGLKDALFGPRRDDPQVRAYVEGAAADVDELSPRQYREMRRAEHELPAGVLKRLDAERRR